jgi:ribosomal protein L24
MASILSSSQIPLIVFGEKEGETARVLYYNAKSNTVYDTGITLQTVRQEEIFTLE